LTSQQRHQSCCRVTQKEGNYTSKEQIHHPTRRTIPRASKKTRVKPGESNQVLNECEKHNKPTSFMGRNLPKHMPMGTQGHYMGLWGIHTSPTVQALQSSKVLKIIKLHYDLIMTPTYTSRVGYLCTSLSLSK
jgi:hypothetical protein